MKVVLMAFLACLAVSVASAQKTDNPLLALATGPIHKLFADLMNQTKAWTGNSDFLQKLDIDYTLKRIFDMGEGQVKNVLFDTVLPTVMRLLKGPGTQLRTFLATLRDRIASLDVKSLTQQLPNYITMATKSLDTIISTLDQFSQGVKTGA